MAIVCKLTKKGMQSKGVYFGDCQHGYSISKQANSLFGLVALAEGVRCKSH